MLSKSVKSYMFLLALTIVDLLVNNTIHHKEKETTRLSSSVLNVNIIPEIILLFWDIYRKLVAG